MVDRIRYTAFFIVLSASCMYYWLTIGGEGRWWLLWPGLSSIVLAAAYGLNRPSLICGKDSTGHVSPFLLLINLPWLAFTWLLWIIIALLSRESTLSLIPGTNVFISRYPLFGVNLSEFDRIFDLTSEFPRFYEPVAQYQCFSNLDGIALCNLQLLPLLNSEERILIHCAQGHGRSATFASLLLAGHSMFATPEAVHLAIISVRPRAKLASSQQFQLRSNSEIQNQSKVF